MGLSDGSFFVVPTDLALERGLSSGLDLTAEQLGDLLEEAARREAVRVALSLLARAPHTRVGLELKLRKRDLDEVAVRHALNRAEELGYLDDASFAEQWVRQRLSRHPEGRLALLAGLARKGVDRALAARTVDRLLPPEAEEEQLLRALAGLNDRSPRKRATRLGRLGFPGHLIRRHVPDLWEDS